MRKPADHEKIGFLLLCIERQRFGGGFHRVDDPVPLRREAVPGEMSFHLGMSILLAPALMERVADRHDVDGSARLRQLYQGVQGARGFGRRRPAEYRPMNPGDVGVVGQDQ